MRSDPRRRLRIAAVVALVALGLGGLAVAYRAARDARTPHAVVLITIDTMRADRLGAYGYTGADSPAIDRLADEGALFTHAYCDIPWTTGSMSSVMTGLYGPAHGVKLHWQRLPESRLTLGEILKEAGFATAAVVGSFPLDSVYGLDQGFDTYDDRFSLPFIDLPRDAPIEHVELALSAEPTERDQAFSAKMRNDAYRADADVTEAAVAWLEEHDGSRFFLWVHYFGPHEKLGSNRNRDQRERIIRAYDPDVTRTDAAVGTLLDAIERLGLDERTLVVLHSDHGQALGEHGIVGHGRDLYEPSVRIPLILRFPGAIPAGTRRSLTAQNVDILPTILDYLGLMPPPGLPGRSLRPSLESGEEDQAPPAFMHVAATPSVRVEIPGVGELFGRTRAVGVRDGRWKYIRTTLAPPCWRDAKSYATGMLGTNPVAPRGATRIPDAECASYSREALYDVSATAPSLGSEQVDLAPQHPEVTARLRAYVAALDTGDDHSEDFVLTDEQRAKLKSLGYLE